MKTRNYLFLLIIFLAINLFSCKKDSSTYLNPSDNLAIDSLVSSKRNIVIWEEIYITAYTRGKNLKFNWSANHGSMLSTDSSSVKYWACPSCLGLNTIQCKVTNEYGTVSDTIMINAYQ